jgi:hypothetical protein
MDEVAKNLKDVARLLQTGMGNIFGTWNKSPGTSSQQRHHQNKSRAYYLKG